MSEPDVEQARLLNFAKILEWEGTIQTGNPVVKQTAAALRALLASHERLSRELEASQATMLEEMRLHSRTVSERDDARVEVERLRRKLPCGHPASLDDSYGGCVLCLTLKSHADGEVYEDQLEAEVMRLRQRVAELEAGR